MTKTPEFSTIAVTTSATFYPENLSLLRDFDHSRLPDGKLPPEVEVAVTSLNILAELLTETQNAIPDHREDMAETLGDIRAALAGFTYRQEHHLPGIEEQFYHARRLLLAINPTNTEDTMSKILPLMTSLQNQPDAATYLDRLQKLYRRLSDRLEENMIPTVQGVLDQGIKHAQTATLQEQAETLPLYEHLLANLSYLRDQGEPESDINSAIDTLRKFRRKTVSGLLFTVWRQLPKFISENEKFETEWTKLSQNVKSAKYPDPASVFREAYNLYLNTFGIPIPDQIRENPQLISSHLNMELARIDMEIIKLEKSIGLPWKKKSTKQKLIHQKTRIGMLRDNLPVLEAYACARGGPPPANFT